MSENSSQNHARDRLNESLSATLDGQASELEVRRVLEVLGSDDDMRAKARRYQAIGDTVRHESNQFMDIDLSAAIRERIENEEVAHQKQEQPIIKPEGRIGNVVSLMDNWWSSLGRVAVAASVAFAFIVGVRNFNEVGDVQTTVANIPEPVTLTQPLQIAKNDFGASGIRAGYSSKQHNTITPEQLAQAQTVANRATQERFRAYALQHAEMSAIQGGQGILPFARLTSFDKQ